MANLTITKAEAVQVVQQFTGPAGEAIAVGQRCRFDTTTGKVHLGNATTAAEANRGGIATHAAAVGEAVTIINQGVVDVGEAMASLAFGATVYVSNTDGSFGDAAGTVTVAAGIVVPGWGNTTADRLLWLFG
ncbi:MAG TPA: hypothetical protein PK205_18920, partial [Promineifilum sp.]|nr:hypothetical protein [Promineifilum sp.]